MLRKRDSGQIALILVLIMTIIASTAVALSGRTTLETRVQEINLDSSQAQLAAESGLEQALRNLPDGGFSGNLDAETSFTVGNNLLSASEGLYIGIRRGETAELTVSGATGNPTSINVHWTPIGNDSSFVSRAIFVTEVRPGLFTDFAYDTYGLSGTGFSLAGNGSSFGFTYNANIPIDPATTQIRVTALGGDMDLGFSPNRGSLVDQLRDIPSVGTVTSGTDETTQERIQYGLRIVQSVNPEVPEIFEHAVFSGESISQ